MATKARRKSKPLTRRLSERSSEVENLCLRQAEIEVRADSVNEEQRSVRIVLASETPVRVLDFEMYDVIDEVLLMDGLDVPAQVPLLNNHARYDARSVIGSIRDLKKTKSRLEGIAYFARSEEAQEVFDLVRDGHLTDFSIGFRPIEVERVKKGETATIGGRKFKGPVRVVTRSQGKEGSAVAIGADPNAKARGADDYLRAYTDPYVLRDEKIMDKLKQLCVRLGMPEDTEDAMGWLESHLAKRSEPTDAAGQSLMAEVLAAVKEAKRSETVSPIATLAETLKPAPEEKETAKRTLEVLRLCQRHGIADTQADAWINEGLTVDQVARKILDVNGQRQTGDPVGLGRVEHVESEKEKFFRAASAALTLRAVQAAKVKPAVALERARGVYNYDGKHQVDTGSTDYDAIQRNQSLVDLMNKPPEGFNDFRYAGLLEIARMYVELSGQRTAFWPRQKIAREAMRLSAVESRRSDGEAFNTTGSFTSLMLDAANKTLLAAYDEAMVTYPIWVRTAPSATDFKELNRIRFGEMPDPEVVPENHPYPEKTTSDARESYRVEKYGEIFSISLEAWVNDDLNAISRIPAMQGSAMRRKINKVVYAILTSNPTMSDGVALFHATSHGANLDDAALAVGTLDTGYAVMMVQQGLTSGTILNITPRYLIVPAALSASALQIITSIAPPAAGGSAAGNSNTSNLYGPNGPRQLIPVVEGQLDADSVTGWYMAADSSQVDTVELTFLEGEESPALSQEDGFETDNLKYKIRQTFAAKAIDYRGLYQGDE